MAIGFIIPSAANSIPPKIPEKPGYCRHQKITLPGLGYNLEFTDLSISERSQIQEFHSSGKTGIREKSGEFSSAYRIMSSFPLNNPEAVSMRKR